MTISCQETVRRENIVKSVLLSEVTVLTEIVPKHMLNYEKEQQKTTTLVLTH